VAELTKIEHLTDEEHLPKRLLGHASLVSRIDSFLEDLNVEPLARLPVKFDIGGDRRTGIFHASTVGSSSGKSLCGKYTVGCGRQLYYDYTSAPSEGAWEPRMRRLLDTGSAIHAQLQAYLEIIASRSEGTEKFTPEADIDPDVNPIAQQMDLSGHADGIYQITTTPDRVRFGVEIKTINEAGYQKTNSPHQEHITQGTIYQKCLDLPLMVFLYYNKNDSSIAEFIQVFDEKRWQAIVDKLNSVRDCALQNIMPDQEAGWHCSNCKYKGICKPPRRGKANTKTTSTFRSQKRNAYA
jgi:CRISPR/Cas system-associated exonuclease Cas4 (RecB family)